MAGCSIRSARSFNIATMRMEVTDFFAVVFNPVAQAKFVHTVSAGYVTGSMFVLSISAFYLLRGRYRGLAIRSITVAASFGLASALSVVVLGDESGYTAGENQKMKIAAIEAMWQTEPAPASFTVIGIPDIKTHTTEYAVRIPWVLGLIATRSIDQPVEGIENLVDEARAADQKRHDRLWRDGNSCVRIPMTPRRARQFEAHVDDLGYALLLKRYTPNVTDATAAADRGGGAGHGAAGAAAVLLVPHHGGARLLLHRAVRHDVRAGIAPHAGAISLAAACLPVVAAAAMDCRGTRLGGGRGRAAAVDDRWRAADVPVGIQRAGERCVDLAGGFVLFYSVLAVVELFLMVRAIRHGPDVSDHRAGADGHRRSAIGAGDVSI